MNKEVPIQSNLILNNQVIDLVNRKVCEESVDKSELDKLLHKIDGWGINKSLVESLVNKHGIERALEGVKRTISHRPKNPSAYLQKVVMDLEWKVIQNAAPQPQSQIPQTLTQASDQNASQPQLHEVRQPSPPPKAQVAGTPQGLNGSLSAFLLQSAVSHVVEATSPTSMDKSWWKGLSRLEKLEIFKSVVWKWPWFETHLGYQKVSVLDESFEEHRLFNDLVNVFKGR